ncbi:hypothetical protein [Sinomonas gamaensis]|uniref:hypothetical protein n=1 Tax=Sinomonas gamaensis TaxID=2565624 RepID=UPI001108CFA6|nr:hypothetical protein [Sinomonas gamaensis]
MSTIPVNRQPAGRPTGGQFAPVEHREPEVSLAADPLARFPHPDPKYPHPMGAWPAGVELPVSAVLGVADVDSTPAHVRDPQLETTGEFPEAVLAMPNGARVRARLLPGDASVEWEGDWEAYAPEGSDERDEIGDVALEYATQSR